MRLDSRSFTLAGLVGLLLAASVQAQEEPVWRLALQLSEGVYVRAGIGAVPAHAVKLDNSHPLIRGVGYLAQRRGTLRRILKLANGRAISLFVITSANIRARRTGRMTLRLIR